MNTAVWILQVILAIKFLSTAVTHGPGQGRQTLQTGIQRMGRGTPGLLYAIAAAMGLAAIGLVLPAAARSLGWLAPAAAAALALLELISIPLHLRCREKPNLIPSLVLLALAAFAAYARWALAPL